MSHLTAESGRIRLPRFCYEKSDFEQMRYEAEKWLCIEIFLNSYGRYWTDHIVPFIFDSSVSHEDRRVILTRMFEIQRHTCVKENNFIIGHLKHFIKVQRDELVSAAAVSRSSSDLHQEHIRLQTLLQPSSVLSSQKQW